MKTSDLLKYYNQDEIINEIMRICPNREVVPRFANGSFGVRPAVLLYKNDLLDSIRNGAISFHISEELWRNPLSLNQVSSKIEMDELRLGWDLILDIDTKQLDYAKVCADLLCKALEYHNIHNYSLKYSGGTGFHIGIPFSAFPEEVDGVKTSTLFPIASQRIALYLREMIKDKLANNLLEIEQIESMAKKLDKNVKDLMENNNLNPYTLLEIDTIALSPRHLFRMPYSINEKSGRVSLPILRKELSDFNPENAGIEKAGFTYKYLDSSLSKRNEAAELLIQSFDWYNKKVLLPQQDDINKKTGRKFTGNVEGYKVPPEQFPPCIKNILLGMEDGKKRGLFVLINYLRSAKYSFEEIDDITKAWNLKNKEPLKDSYIKSQITWAKKTNSYLPPNCNASMYYTDIRVCKKDNICENIKNPLNYSYKKWLQEKNIKKK
ncbi:DNA primase large subunit PriL [Candidatus Tiddalikarchaeum anstoanum]|nr:DNA primase large subunit PriL [Candidatus Tiddalikarchaeum anstoanum]